MLADVIELTPESSSFKVRCQLGNRDSTVQLLRLLPRFHEAHAALDVLADRQEWSREEIFQWQLRRINETWRHARQFVPYYRELFQQQRLPESFDSIEEYCRQIPRLPKSKVRTQADRFLSERCEPGSWHHTTGSTGSPMRFYRSRVAHRAMLQAKYRLYADWGVDPLDRMAVLWRTAQGGGGSLSRASQRSRQRAIDCLRGRLRLSAHYSDPQLLSRQLRKIEAFRPASLYGFSQAVWLLAQQANRDRFSCDSLKAVFMTSEPVSERMQREVEQAFQVPVVIEYGATECELIAGQSADGTLRVREDLVLVETLPRPDGLRDIVLTLLGNPSYPLLRYEIEDVAPAPLELPSRGFAILPAVGGRNDDLLWTRHGRRLHPTLVRSCFERQFADASIRRYRLHQKDDGSISALLEVESGSLSPGTTQAIESQLKALVEGYPVAVAVTECIQVPEAGKLRAVTSDLQCGSP